MLDKALDANSLVVNVVGKEYKYTENGVMPLLMQLNTADGLRNAVVADRVIGRAAAFLMVYGGVAEVYTRVLSAHAQEVFDRYGVRFYAEKTVDYIVNRRGDGMCPMEEACLTVDTPEQAYEVLLKKVKDSF